MKKPLLFLLTLCFFIPGIAQRINTPKEFRDHAVRMNNPSLERISDSHEYYPVYKPKTITDEVTIGMTRYDLQSNKSVQNRIHFYDDGTIGTVWTMGFNETAFYQRGTGYNYYDGTQWGPMPEVRLEDDRTGWPSYEPFGENGEMYLAHYSGAEVDGLIYGIREEKGTGDWMFTDFFGPPGFEGLIWSKLATGGVDNSVVHLIALTRPNLYYQGQYGALLYSRSDDGGNNWFPQNVVFDELNANYYYGFNGDSYEIQAQGDNVAILIGDNWIDLVLLKSTDGGDTWTKTIIWECPYPLWGPNPVPTDTFYCVDGAHTIDFDPDGKVHVCFGINRTYSDGGSTFWFPLVGGLGYWNEDRPTFSNDLNALNPYPDAGYSELVEDYSLVGWEQDINGNGEWDILGNVGLYYVGTSSMPSIHVDDQHKVFVVFSSVTETFDNGSQDYRRLWARVSPNGGEWWGQFHGLTSDLTHLYDECVFPSLSHSSDDKIYLTYQLDQEPGLAVRGDEDEYTDNQIVFLSTDKEEPIGPVVDERFAIFDHDVSQNKPNPFSLNTVVAVNLHCSADLLLEVVNLTGQCVYREEKIAALPGLNKFTIDGNRLESGVYFYSITSGNSSVTRKMIRN